LVYLETVFLKNRNVECKIGQTINLYILANQRKPPATAIGSSIQRGSVSENNPAPPARTSISIRREMKPRALKPMKYLTGDEAVPTCDALKPKLKWPRPSLGKGFRFGTLAYIPDRRQSGSRFVNA